MLSLLARVEVTGEEHFPSKGPLIVAANHVSIEGLMLLARIPWQIEMLGAAEIPVRPKYMIPFMQCYGLIPIKRGLVDRSSLNMALDLLEQGGVVGIFPQGGFWDPASMQAHSGVAWLSHKANAPVLPVGFGGMRDAMGAMLSLKHPVLKMNIGELIPPVDVKSGKARKAALQESANAIMAQIGALIPEEEKQQWAEDESFDFEVIIEDAEGNVVPVPDGMLITFRRALGQFFHRPLLLKTMAQNLALPVRPLQTLDDNCDAEQIADASQVVLDYLDQNSHFLGYRFGYKVGQAMRGGLVQLRNVARWASKHGYRLRLRPIRRYRRWGSKIEIVEEMPYTGKSGVGHGS